MKRIMLLFLCVCFLCGCGAVPIKGTKLKSDVVQRAGLAERVTSPFGLSPVAMFHISNEKYKFLSNDEQAVWFCTFKHLTFAVPPVLTAKWFSPDGKVFLEEKAKSYFLIIEGARAELPIKGTKVAQMYGKWSVEVYFEDNLIDRQDFTISEGENDK